MVKKKEINIPGADGRLKSVGIIMDGNGRWAKARGLSRNEGHKAGAKVIREVIECLNDLDVHHVTLYAFSTENWKRPQKEVDTIMKIFDDYIEECFLEMEDDNVHFRFIGNLNIFPRSLQEKMAKIDRETAHKPFILNIAVNYGGREEITHACNELIKQGKTEITEDDLSANIYTAGCPDPDLIVRTGGDLRTSNFLLWQSAYAEYYFTDVLWPDYSSADVDEAVRAFYSRKRRFGGV